MESKVPAEENSKPATHPRISTGHTDLTHIRIPKMNQISSHDGRDRDPEKCSSKIQQKKVEEIAQEQPEPGVIVKKSAVNLCFSDLNLDILSENDMDCEFYRVVRVATEIKNKIEVGVLLVIKKEAGVYLKNFSNFSGEEHRLIKESDILAQTDF